MGISRLVGGGLLSVVLGGMVGCATVTTPPEKVEAAISKAAQDKAQVTVQAPQAKVLKRKLAIGRFTNETLYGRSLLTDANLDPLGKQASDMLASRLVASNKFLVFERPDLQRLRQEQKLNKQADLIGVDALILGSVTEFGRSTTGQSGFLSATKLQTARAKVEVRLVDVKTGLVFFSAMGTGEASAESGEVAGFGSKAAYDATLNDKAIGAATSDVLSALMNKLEERPWRTDILKSEGQRVYVSGGARQGLKAGDLLVVMREGEQIKSQQSGFKIALPPTPLAKIRVVALFGDSESNEGAVADIVSGNLPAGKTDGLFVAEDK